MELLPWCEASHYDASAQPSCGREDPMSLRDEPPPGDSWKNSGGRVDRMVGHP